MTSFVCHDSHGDREYDRQYESLLLKQRESRYRGEVKPKRDSDGLSIKIHAYQLLYLELGSGLHV